MTRYSYSTLFLFVLVVLSSCRTDQPLFANGVYTGLFAIAGGIVGIIYVMKKIL